MDIHPCSLLSEYDTLRQEVREFIAEFGIERLPPVRRAGGWMNADPEFSRQLGMRGWLGMTWPMHFGGHERSMLERYVVLEELLAASAPVAAHWVADRQSGPLLIRYSPDVLAPRIVPKIVRGEAFFCIGMSEPDSGSDLASISTRAARSADGWVINGRKVWTSGAHRSHYMIALVRTGERSDNRHNGLSQFLIDMNSPGLTIRPIVNQLGEHDFNEVTFDNVEVPDDHLIGAEGDGWKQVTAELGFERSGPERYLSSTQLLLEMLDQADPSSSRHAVALGRIVASYGALRQMSIGVTAMLASGESPGVVAALVKDQGALIEQAMPDIAHELFGDEIDPDSPLAQVRDFLTLAAPSFSLRGGTREILRGIVARGLDLR